jgi:3-oxoacyl-(acyl-carrier-protein) synthase
VGAPAGPTSLGLHMSRRVVITGVGVVCSIADSFAQLVTSIRDGRMGMTWVGSLGAERGTGWAVASVTTQETTDALDRPPYRDPVTRLAFHAATEALGQSGWEEHSSLLTAAGVYVGTAFGGLQTLESAFFSAYGEAAQPDAYTIPNCLANAPAARISSRYHSLGPCVTYSSGSAASSQAIGEAFIAIREGRLERALAGGAEACLTRSVLGAWSASEMAPVDPDDPATSCRPFSRDRAGLVLGEGAAMFTLEALDSAHRRGAPILCEVLGFGSTSSASVIDFPHARSLAAAMQAALEDAHLSACDIDYIAAHATGSRSGDLAEATAILQVFGGYGRRLAVSSTKAQHGHLVGASGALGVAVGMLAIGEGVVPATCNLRERDEQLGDLDFVPNASREVGPRIRRVLCNSFSFWDAHAVLVIGRPEIDSPVSTARRAARTMLTEATA